MHAFFQGWRRKTGCVTLLMAVAVVGMWFRSSMVYDQCVWTDSNRKHVIYSLNGEFGWWYWDDSRCQQLTFGSRSLGPKDRANWQMLHDMIGAMRDAKRWTVSYRFIGPPLTLLSAYLILWKPRKQNAAARPPL